MTRIYLVEDHAILRDGVRALLETAGFEVVGESDDPQQALREIAQLRPDVLLLDLNLQGQSGMELLKQLKQARSSVRTLVLTMSSLPHNATEALQLGAMGYVLKGSPATELLQAVRAVARGQRHVGPGVGELMLQAMEVPKGDDPLSQLSPRELKVMRLVVRGRTSVEIGIELNLSSKTVDTYRSRLMAKLGVGDVTALVRLAVRTGLLDVHADE
ncbi:response regulator [Azohydromonas aeria]|uniref:response regulator n=1 Tax=Azohydromonas aeria TaxID=2590212 RepID=UPI0012FCF565|nr:response regulator transcription factor [Azohydromonas aeria]